ncbi:MAG: D-Ala-D-Ala carboxypeptidase family metallohydrolase [Fidelibacterota bacterium]
MRLSPHFHLEEFTRSKTAGEKGIKNFPDVEQIQNITALCKVVLEEVRKHFGKPVLITSGYRSPELNRAVGGSQYSQHVKGEAADFVVKDITVSKVFDSILHESLPFDQCIHEKRDNREWIHISHKRNRREKLFAAPEQDGRMVYRAVK